MPRSTGFHIRHTVEKLRHERFDLAFVARLTDDGDVQLFGRESALVVWSVVLEAALAPMIRAHARGVEY